MSEIFANSENFAYVALLLSAFTLVRQEVLFRRDRKRRLKERQEKLIARYGFERVQGWSK